MRTRKTDSLALSLEMTLLLLCSRNEPDDAARANIRNLIQSQPHWKRFHQLALRHRVYPVVYQNLKRFGGAAVDTAVLSALGKSTACNRMWSLLACGELFRIMELFEAAGVRMVCLKGPVLSQLTCGDISMRVSKDLDLFVSPADIEKAGQILLERGYERKDGYDELTPRQRAALLKFSHHFSYSNQKTGLDVELHWRPYFESYNFTFEMSWATRSTQLMNGKSVSVLGAEQNILYLALHGSKHMWFRLKWLCDVAEIIKKGGIDWNRLAERAGALGITHLLAQTLILSNTFYQTEIHDDLFDERTRRVARRLSRMAIPFILNEDEIAFYPGHSLFILEKKYKLVWNAGLRKKLRHVKKLVVPNMADFEQYRLSDRYFVLYYFLRPFLGLGRALRAIRKRHGKA